MHLREFSLNLGLLPIFGIISVLAGCGGGGAKVETIPPNEPAVYVNADGTGESMKLDTLVISYPHMIMADGQITLNDRCPVRRARLNRRLPAIYVNGRPVGFC